MQSFDDYALRIGRFWIQINSLELLLRLYLTKKSGQREIGLELPVGEECADTYLTSYDSLPKLASKYNELVPPSSAISYRSIERVRDALAHGRSLSSTPSLPLTMTKFSKPDRKSKLVRVEFKEVLSASFLDDAAKELSVACRKAFSQLNAEFPVAENSVQHTA